MPRTARCPEAKREKCRFVLDGAIPAVTPHTPGLTYLADDFRYIFEFLSYFEYPSSCSLKFPSISSKLCPYHCELVSPLGFASTRIDSHTTAPPLGSKEVRNADRTTTQWPERAQRPRPTGQERPPSPLTLTVTICLHRRPRARPAMAESMRS